jgi:hypothetical protein
MFTLLRILFIQPSSAQDVLISMSDEIPVPAKEHIGKNSLASVHCRFIICSFCGLITTQMLQGCFKCNLPLRLMVSWAAKSMLLLFT